MGQHTRHRYASESRWSTDLASLKYAQQHGKEYLAVTHSANDDAEAARYGWATVLLGAEGRAQFALHGDYTNEIVVVNPTSGQRSADLPGTYSGSARSNVTSVTLAPNTAAILTRDSPGERPPDTDSGAGDGGGKNVGTPAAPDTGPGDTGGGAGGADRVRRPPSFPPPRERQPSNPVPGR